MDAQHGWKSLLGLPGWNVGIRGHPDAGHCLKDNFFDAVAVSLNLTQLTRFQWAWLRGKAAPRFQQKIAEICACLLPVFDCSGCIIIGTHNRGLLFHEDVKSLCGLNLTLLYLALLGLS